MDTLRDIATELGLPFTDDDTAKSLYHAIALRTHPDKVKGKEEMFKRANLAYEQVTNKSIPFDTPFDDIFSVFVHLFEGIHEHMKEQRRDLDELQRGVKELEESHKKLQDDLKWIRENLSRQARASNILHRERIAAEKRRRQRRRDYYLSHPTIYGCFTPLASSSSSEEDEDDDFPW
jgi:curved DNA-binding protein CbpA